LTTDAFANLLTSNLCLPPLLLPPPLLLLLLLLLLLQEFSIQNDSDFPALGGAGGAGGEGGDGDKVG
jgi:hypothetical protein